MIRNETDAELGLRPKSFHFNTDSLSLLVSLGFFFSLSMSSYHFLPLQPSKGKEISQ